MDAAFRATICPKSPESALKVAFIHHF